MLLKKINLVLPVGYPINIEITGDDYSNLIDKAEKITEFINKSNILGIEELKIDVNKSRAINLVHIDRKKAGELGISSRSSWPTIKNCFIWC